MNITMLFMIKLCVQMRNKKQMLKRKERLFTGEHFYLGVCLTVCRQNHQIAFFHITDFDTRYFWAWTDFQSYLDFLLLFSVISSFVMYIFIESPAFVELVGFMAVFTEAMLGMPQLFQNYMNKSTKGMR